MQNNRFQHMITGKYLGLVMDNPPYHNNNKKNLITAYTPEMSSKFNSNWNIHEKDHGSVYREKISTATWKPSDSILYLSIIPDDLDDPTYPVDYCGLAYATDVVMSHFYFKPAQSTNEKAYFQLCAQFSNTEYCIKIDESSKLKDIAYIIANSNRVALDKSTYFSIEPAV